ncbi:hypothetical protein Taro_003481 [Colocasia esculenta]|uniref:Protein kinase domain-containing protein n=1 Tax=Colocasia esculenta TaxID=4460 RepID=A0A843TLM7_COLES|nr:hypothetical protein [Colocasia esculenta]
MDGYVSGFLFFLLPFLLSPQLSFQELIPNQTNVMASLSRTLNQTSGNTSGQDPCRWKGVTCTKGSPSQVIGLSLCDLGLSNTSFLRYVCSLDSLRFLNLSSNSLTSIPGSFITDCGKLENLKLLNFSGNKLSGMLPNFSGFRALEILDLSYNLLEGSIDLGLGDLVNLRSLNVSFNRFNGSIPTKLRTPAALQELSLSHNHFQGTIFPGASVYKNLTLLDLSFNQFSDSDLHSIANLSKLEVLILSSNKLDGEVPSSLSRLEKLHWFAANTNNFSGAIPRGITNHLQVLDLSFNRLNGSIPPDLLSSPNLESIDLSSNSLEGPIPVNVSRRLFRLRLGRNRLNGSIPRRIGELGELQYLELDGNSLEGEIPLQLGDLVNLTLLSLANNQLKGALPKELGNLQKLVVMKLQMNQIDGSIPDEFSGLGQLLTLNLSRNSLSGAIPSSISNLINLTVLNLGCNQLDGSIPRTISNLGNLMELQLGNNNLSGDIPPMPGRLSTALNLSRNNFGGSIPTTLSLPLLEILDLSHNGFTGRVPDFFLQMRSLTHLVLSYNRLSGVLPKLPPWVTVDVAGNSLRNDTNSAVTAAPRRKISTALIVAVSVAAAVVGSGFAAAILIFVASRRFYRVEDETPQTGPQSGDDLPQIIEGSFLTEDRSHRSQINFAIAIEEVSNPGNVLRKSRFSTYYKAAMPGGTSYCVKKLNWSNKVFQMGNQGRFRQELEDLGRLNNSNVMTPLAYVLTADSAHLFYEDLHKGTLFDFLHKGVGDSLDWPCRYGIALGVAQGLTFLHGCKQPVLLLDLSTKSILLKSLKEPQIADIELFKVTDPSRSTGSISTLAGSVGYIPPGNIYSFGVVLLELLTGKPPVNEGIPLAKWAQSYATRVREWEQILDQSICHTLLGVQSQMHSVMKIALSCVNQSAEARPKAKNVLRMLFNAR